MLYRLKPAQQHYDWGGCTFLREFITAIDKDKCQLPLAELWYGDHPRAPAYLWDELDNIALCDWLPVNRQALSEASIRRYGVKLPFLLKILDVRLPLSIQVHPNKQQAEKGYALEEVKGIALDAKNRLYKDNNHKPEMMVALSDFWLLHGFSEIELIMERLAKHECLQPVAQILRNKTLSEAYADILQADPATLRAWIQPILEASCSNKLDDPDYWIQFTTRHMNISYERLDPGLLSFYLLNLVHLQPGEGIVQLACIPHAYLRGQNIEIMATSDNVLRAGLTSKFVAINELLEVIDATSISPTILAAPDKYEVQHIYPSSVDDFTLIVGTLGIEQSREFITEEASILLILEGHVQFVSGSNKKNLLIGQGEAVFIPHHTKVNMYSYNEKVRWVWASSSV